MALGARKKKLAQADIDMDMTPMIDVIFLLIIFFILAGKITAEISVAKITVPPTKTPEEIDLQDDWTRVKVEVWGSTQEQGGGSTARHEIKVGLNQPFVSRGSTGKEAFDAYVQLREVLNDYYDRAEKYQDPMGSGMMLPKVVLELRADADTEYRVVQEIQQVASDSVDPATLKPKDHSGNPGGARPFVHFHFTTRKPDEF